MNIILDVWATYTVDHDGNERAVIRIDDVTERVRMIKDLEEARIRAEESDRLKMAFLANMSHEIRTPLNSIVGFSELLYDTTEEEEMAQYISIIKQSNETLLNLIGNILELSKIESGVVEYSPSDYNFTQYFLDVSHTWQKEFEDQSLDLNVNVPDSELHINHDKKIINQILTNYLSNALKYTKVGFVNMHFSCTPTELQISVQDTGIGIADANKDQIFGRFAKLDDFAQGTGLGLSICRALAETCKGEVGFSSQEGVGSTFWLKLPLDPSKTKLIAKENKLEICKSEINKVSKLTLGGKSILVAEDNDSNYLLLEASLRDKYNLFRAKNGVEAVTLAQNCEFDAILMDMKMPVMDGLTAIREIRKFDKEIKIITLTANAFDYDREQAIKAGSDFFLTKPLKRNELREVLSENNFLLV